MRDFCVKKLAEAVDKLQAIKSLGPKSARATHRLLITCGTKLLTFLASTVPPSIIEQVLSDFDDHIDNVFFGALSAGSCSEDRFERARLRAYLPTPFRFVLLTKVSGMAFFCRRELSDPVLFVNVTVM